MADKLEKMQALASVAKQFGGDPESEMRNRLLEAQIQAGREQTQAMRHQTQGGMMKSMMDMQKMQGDLSLNPARQELLKSEIATQDTTRLGLEQTQRHAEAAQAGIIEGRRLMNEGLETQNQTFVEAGQASILQNTQKLRDLTSKADVSGTIRDEFVAPHAVKGRKQGITSKYAQDVAQGNTARSQALSEIIKNLPQSWVNLPPELQSRMLNIIDLDAPASIQDTVPLSDPPSASGLNLQAMSSAALTTRALLRQLEAAGVDITEEEKLLLDQTTQLQDRLTDELTRRSKNLNPNQ